jgi:hypothetical protein
MSGTGSGYGFSRITEIGAAMESAAKKQSSAELRRRSLGHDLFEDHQHGGRRKIAVAAETIPRSGQVVLREIEGRAGGFLGLQSPSRTVEF